MQCPRCEGTMIQHSYSDYEGTYLPVQGWRCLACGEVLDPVILSNRKATSTVRNSRIGVE